MTRSVRSRVSAIVGGAYRLVEDTFFVRLVVAARRLWSASWLLSVLLLGLSVLCLIGAGLIARTVFLGVRPATDWLIWPVLAALLAFLVMLELFCASLMSGLHGLLRLSYDVGRHRIGTLLIIATILSVAAALRALTTGTTAQSDIIVLCGIALTSIVLAIWFERAYRRPAYPGFRDFHGDVVAAREHFARAAHVG
jgi:hypothetical protein